MKPLISIIIPVYNHAHTLERCVRSLIAQTYRPLEIIIVNDGSTDEINRVIEKIKIEIEQNNKDLTFKFFSQPNSGAPAARNHGYRESTGEYVMFYDADTIAQPHMFEKLMQALDSNPEASYAYCQFKFGWKLMKLQPFNGEDLKKYNYIDTMSLVRRTALNYETMKQLNNGQGPFDPTLKRFQDWDLWLTLLEHGKTGVFVPEVLRQVLVARKGMSSWLPSFVYKLPWKIQKVRDYDAARLIVMKKHHLV